MSSEEKQQSITQSSEFKHNIPDDKNFEKMQAEVGKSWDNFFNNISKFKYLTIEDYNTNQSAILYWIRNAISKNGYMQDMLSSDFASYGFTYQKQHMGTTAGMNIGPEHTVFPLFVDLLPNLLNSLLMEFSDTGVADTLRYGLFLQDAKTEYDKALQALLLSEPSISTQEMSSDFMYATPVELAKNANPEAYAAIEQKYEQAVAQAKENWQSNMNRHKIKNDIWLKYWSDSPAENVTGLGKLGVNTDLLKPAQKLEPEELPQEDTNKSWKTVPDEYVTGLGKLGVNPDLLKPSQKLKPEENTNKNLLPMPHPNNLPSIPQVFGTLSILGQVDDLIQQSQNAFAQADAVSCELAQAETQGITVGSNTVNNATDVHVAAINITSSAPDLNGTMEEAGQALGLGMENYVQGAAIG